MPSKDIIDILRIAGLYGTKKECEKADEILIAVEDYFYFVPKRETDGGDPDFFKKCEYGQLFLNLKEEERDLYLSMRKSEIVDLAEEGIELKGLEFLLLDAVLFIYIKLARYNKPGSLVEFDAQSGAFAGHLLYIKYMEAYETMKKNKGAEARMERRRKIVKGVDGAQKKEYIYMVDGEEMPEEKYNEWYASLAPDERAEALSRVTTREK